ncbi:MAG: hypothetical protein K5668_04110 [Lachnospiraceae bacterium]|nr:hypothetical protein [Lachnospiraceae bacterium]
MDILNFSGMYDEYDLSLFREHRMIHLKGIGGTKLYIDEEGEKEIIKKIKGSDSRVHLIDIGDYHYVTRLYLYEIKEPFDLLVFDNHDDCKEPEFEGIRSCGSWIKDAMEDMPETLASVKLIKGDEDIRYLKGEFDRERPLYISVDKDVLSEELCPTNWDQGEMTVEELTRHIRSESEGRRILGLDICGGPAPGTALNIEDIIKNQSVDMAIIALLC